MVQFQKHPFDKGGKDCGHRQKQDCPKHYPSTTQGKHKAITYILPNSTRNCQKCLISIYINFNHISTNIFKEDYCMSNEEKVEYIKEALKTADQYVIEQIYEYLLEVEY